jgi:DNA-binding beta-propeller fold protein YncE
MTNSYDTRSIDVRNCVACGNDHEGLTFTKLAQTEVVAGHQMTHSAICPETGTVIFTEVME